MYRERYTYAHMLCYNKLYYSISYYTIRCKHTVARELGTPFPPKARRPGLTERGLTEL